MKFENNRRSIKSLHKSKAMSSIKTRKAEERIFLKKWEEDYLFVENNGKPLCLLCQKTVSVAKEYNIKRHYDTTHKQEDIKKCGYISH